MGGSVHHAKVYYVDLMDLPIVPTHGSASHVSASSLPIKTNTLLNSVAQSNNNGFVAPPSGRAVTLPPPATSVTNTVNENGHNDEYSAFILA